jgi:hypothetical protein
LSAAPSGGISKAIRNGLAGVAILLVIGTVSARVSLHERASERVRAEKLAAAEQKLAAQQRLAQEAAAAQEATLRALVEEEEQLRLDAERQRREVQVAQAAMASAADTHPPEAPAVRHSSATQPAPLVGSVSRIRALDPAHPCRSIEEL